MFKKEFSDDERVRRTLCASEVNEAFNDDFEGPLGLSTRTHADGWTITGEVVQDWICWVNAFEATHPVYGRVWGDFESEVFADSEEGYEAFFAQHTPEEWDPWDI